MSSLNHATAFRDDQLRRINRVVSHDLKNKIGAIVGAAELVQEDWISEAERRKFIDIVVQNARALQDSLADLSEMVSEQTTATEELAQ